MKFYTQFDPKPQEGESFIKPSVTVPDESMTIPEIIAKFVRFGTAPVALHADEGDNEAFEPDFDPLDFQPKEILEDLRNLGKSPEKGQETEVSQAPAVDDKETVKE